MYLPQGKSLCKIKMLKLTSKNKKLEDFLAQTEAKSHSSISELKVNKTRSAVMTHINGKSMLGSLVGQA